MCAAGTTCQPWSGRCASDGGCAYESALINTPCELGTCDGQGACLPNPYPYTPSNFVPAEVPILDGGVSFRVSCPTTIDSSGPSISSACAQLPPHRIISRDGGSEVLLVAMNSMRIDAAQALVLNGSRPIVFAVIGDADLDGSLSAYAGASPPASCSPGTGTNGLSDSDFNFGGAGGGGFGTAGARGGQSRLGIVNASAGAANGVEQNTPLRGGCPGGNGAVALVNRGEGGGAVQISATGKVTVRGFISAPGLGGGGGASGNIGGGGGGSGGAILLEADEVAVTSSARLTANGGGGGAGGTSTTAGSNGQPGSSSSSIPSSGGGPNGSCGGAGGSGGAVQNAPGIGSNGGTGTSCHSSGAGRGGGGGAGGGAVGRIRINRLARSGSSPCQLAASVVSPEASVVCR
jgi:hypothetical protein